MWYVYILLNKDRNFRYVGITENLEKRLVRHNAGGTRSTKPYRSFDKIIEIESVETRIEARRLEKFYKSGFGREKLNKMFNK